MSLDRRRAGRPLYTASGTTIRLCLAHRRPVRSGGGAMGAPSSPRRPPHGGDGGSASRPRRPVHPDRRGGRFNLAAVVFADRPYSPPPARWRSRSSARNGAAPAGRPHGHLRRPHEGGQHTAPAPPRNGSRGNGSVCTWGRGTLTAISWIMAAAAVAVAAVAVAATAAAVAVAVGRKQRAACSTGEGACRRIHSLSCGHRAAAGPRRRHTNDGGGHGNGRP